MPKIDAAPVVCDLFDIHRGNMRRMEDDGDLEVREGRVFSVTLCGHYAPDDENFFEARRFVHISLSGNGRYVTVHGAVSGIDPENDWHPQIYDMPAEKWEYKSCHDSAWRSDGVDSILSEAQQDLIKDLATQAGKKDGLALRDVHMSNSINVTPEEVVMTISPQLNDRGREQIAKMQTRYAWQREKGIDPAQKDDFDRTAADGR